MSSRSIVIAESVGIERSPDDVWAYVSDFSRAAEWRTGVVESTQSPPGPLAVGVRLREVARIMGRRLVTETVVGAVEPGRGYTFEHVSGSLPASGGCTVAAEGPGRSRLDYRLQLDLRGPRVLLAPVLRRSGRRMVRSSLDGLRARLETEGADSARP